MFLKDSRQSNVCFVFGCQGGQCIYSSKEGSDDLLDLNSLLHHLRPYFLHGNNRVNGHMTSKALLNEFIQVERTQWEPVNSLPLQSTSNRWST